MGFPYFNPPGIQKRNAYERGDWFVPTGGVEPDSVNEELNYRHAKVKKIIKVTLIVLGIVGFLVLGYFCLTDLPQYYVKNT